MAADVRYLAGIDDLKRRIIAEFDTYYSTYDPCTGVLLAKMDELAAAETEPGRPINVIPHKQSDKTRDNSDKPHRIRHIRTFAQVCRRKNRIFPRNGILPEPIDFRQNF